MSLTKPVYIVSGVRTPIGELAGSLASVSAVELAATVIAEAIVRARVPKEAVGEVMMGIVLKAGLGQNVARQALLKAGLPNTVPGLDVGQVCASGLRSVVLGAQSIMAGDNAIVVAGGTENMSQAPYLQRQARAGLRLGHVELTDSILSDGLTCGVNLEHMGLTAERLAERYGITREEQDAFAVQSHHRAVAAAMAYQREIVAVPVPQRKGEPVLVTNDERVRDDANANSMAKLRPAFKKDGTVTAANASGINDGAAALVLADEAAIKAHNLTPRARITGWANAALDPAVMGLGPVEAIRALLRKTDTQLDDYDAIELNEAFAAQSLAVMKELGLDAARVNARGGAVALGHPIGASGARILVTLLHLLEDHHARRGIASLCVGTGMGLAIAIERI